MTDGTFLFVGFDVERPGAVHATQHTNDVGSGTDDQVAIYLWPDGAQGFSYSFSSNPIGTHYQSSTENTAYAPTWWSAGRIVPGGYTVTMKLPLSIMRGGGASPWRIQVRATAPDTLDDFVWALGKAEQQGADQDVRYSGYLNGMPVRRAATRPQPRLQVYGLAAVASRAIGGSTSRSGADIAIPVTPTASLIAAIHPDYSNVALDQQTTRPPPTAGSSMKFARFSRRGRTSTTTPCASRARARKSCTRPRFPRPATATRSKGLRAGSACSFDAVRYGRNDTAQAVGAHIADPKYKATVNRIAVDMPGLKEEPSCTARHTTATKVCWNTLPTAPKPVRRSPIPAKRRERTPASASDKSSLIGLSTRKIGAEYDPFEVHAALGMTGWSAIQARAGTESEEQHPGRELLGLDRPLPRHLSAS